MSGYTVFGWLSILVVAEKLRGIQKMLRFSISPVAVNERVEEIADGNGHQGEHEHPRPCRRTHCGPDFSVFFLVPRIIGRKLTAINSHILTTPHFYLKEWKEEVTARLTL